MKQKSREYYLSNLLRTIHESRKTNRYSQLEVFTLKTRMHSSRMRTVRCSGHRGRVCVSQHALGRGVSAQGVSAQGVSAQGRCGVCPRGCLPGGVWPGGCLPMGRGDLARGRVWPGGCLPRGVSARRVCPVGYTPPCKQNDRRLWKHNLATTTLGTVTISVHLSG